MSIFDFKRKEVVRIKVKLCNGDEEDVYKKFSVDPHITSFEVMQRIIARAFNLTCDFKVSYLATDDYGDQFYLPLLSDWDLDAAILTASDPVLRMKIELRPRESELEEWDIVVPGEIPSMQRASRNHHHSTTVSRSSTTAGSSTSLSFISQMFTSQVEKTVHTVQKALVGMKLTDAFDNNAHNWKPSKQPMSDAEFKHFTDNIGRLVMPREFKHSVYLGGLEPSLRKVGWRLLLDIYPPGLTGQERLTYLRHQTQQYGHMKQLWKQAYADGHLSQHQLNLIAGISVDVVRTDRSHSFYASETKENSKISQLFDLLATYSLYHPSVGYSQGMSDLASPLLFVQGDEGAAYVCLCALMRRLKHNFHANGKALLTKLQHLHDVVVFYDPEFAQFLRQRGLADMFFAHRWILLELKREFRFEDCLRILEVQWAALPPDNTDDSVQWKLMECGMSTEVFSNSSNGTGPVSPIPPSSETSQPNSFYLKLQALRRSSTSHASPLPTAAASGTTKMTGEGNCEPSSGSAAMDIPPSAGHIKSNLMPMDYADNDVNTKVPNLRPVPGHGLIVVKDGVVELPSLNELGFGNPFLLFLCFSLLMEYREPLMRTVQEMFDFAQFFRHLSQNHSVTRILCRARHMFDEYIRDQETRRKEMDGYPEMLVSL